jgi:hypothetical protein
MALSLQKVLFSKSLRQGKQILLLFLKVFHLHLVFKLHLL